MKIFKLRFGKGVLDLPIYRESYMRQLSFYCILFFNYNTATFSQKMLVYDALDGRFVQVKLRPKQPSCCICGDSPTILSLQDYEQFCNASATDKVK